MFYQREEGLVEMYVDSSILTKIIRVILFGRDTQHVPFWYKDESPINERKMQTIGLLITEGLLFVSLIVIFWFVMHS